MEKHASFNRRILLYIPLSKDAGVMVASVLPVFDKATWTVLLVTAAGLIAAMTPFGND